MTWCTRTIEGTIFFRFRISAARNRFSHMGFVLIHGSCWAVTTLGRLFPFCPSNVFQGGHHHPSHGFVLVLERLFQGSYRFRVTDLAESYDSTTPNTFVVTAQ